MREFVDVARALADSGRVRILIALRGRELCVYQLAALLDLAPSTISKHMSVLRQVCLVEYRKEGTWAYYRRSGHNAPKRTQAALRWLDSSIANRRITDRDAGELEKVLKIPLEELRRTVSH